MSQGKALCEKPNGVICASIMCDVCLGELYEDKYRTLLTDPARDNVVEFALKYLADHRHAVHEPIITAIEAWDAACKEAGGISTK